MTIKEPLNNGVVLLRRFRADDAPQVYEAVRESAAQISPWLPDLGSIQSVDDVRTWIAAGPAAWAENRAYDLAIVDAQSGEILGGCGLSQINQRHRFANLYYWVRTSRTGHGIATSAVRLIARFGLENIGLQRIEIIVPVDNAGSARVAQKAGARLEGTLRNRLLLDGAIHDALMFALVPGDLDRHTEP